jgi:hypothetical protein
MLSATEALSHSWCSSPGLVSALVSASLIPADPDDAASSIRSVSCVPRDYLTLDRGQRTMNDDREANPSKLPTRGTLPKCMLCWGALGNVAPSASPCKEGKFTAKMAGGRQVMVRGRYELNIISPMDIPRTSACVCEVFLLFIARRSLVGF